MRTFILTLFIAIIFSSCAFHSGNISSGPTIDCPMRSFVTGEARTVQLFGLGGLDKNALILEAKGEIYSKYLINKNIKFTNFSVDFKTTYIFFYSSTKATVSAELYDCDTSGSRKYLMLLPAGLEAGDSIIFENNNRLCSGRFNYYLENGKCKISYKGSDGLIKNNKVNSEFIFKTTLNPGNKDFFGYEVTEEILVEASQLSSSSKEVKSCKIIGLNKKRLLISFSTDDGKKKVMTIDKNLIK